MGFVSQFGRSVDQEAGREDGSGQLDLHLPDYATGTVHHEATLDDGTVVHHHQVFDKGVLVDWTEDDEPGPWALLRNGSPLTTCPSGVATPEDVAAVRLRLGDEIRPIPLLDDLPAPAFDALAHIPDATARLRFEVFGTPVGTQLAEVRYVDGSREAWLVSGWEEPTEEQPAFGAPEMAVSMSFRNYLKMRAGQATALEAIEDGGTVDARWTLLLLLHGLIQSPAYVAAYRAMPVLPDELGWWGEVAPHIPPAED
ncbi:MAG TPA: hypothetical protein PLS63_11780 [Microthrixaceae bacterium]|nr:hypothetical protein [Microthrixaceae bacterium]